MDYIGQRTVRDLLTTQAHRVPDRPFLVYEAVDGHTRSETYDTFWSTAAQTARVFYDELGVRKGKKVAIHLSNRPAYLEVWFALTTLGAVTVHSNTKNTVREVAYTFETADVEVVVTESAFADDIRAVMAESDVSELVCADGEVDDAVDLSALREEALVGLPAVDLSREDPAQILFTSGTTSDPKGVVLTHANLLAAGERQAKQLAIRGDDRNSTALPLYHVNAQTSALASLTGGATFILFEKFETTDFIDQLQRHEATITAIIGTQLRAMLAKDAVDEDNALRVITYAINVPDEMKEQFEAAVDAPLLNGYGMTETMSLVSQAPLSGDKRWPSVGRPTYDRDVYIVDETGDPVPTEETGEIAVAGERGMTIFKKYYGMPEKTAAAFTNEGWLLTGDYGRLDEDGYLYFVDRKKNVIETRGENVSEREVETVLESIDGVSEAAVVGAPHEIYGEVVKAYVTLEDGSLTSEAIIDHATQDLADFKVPAEVQLVDSLPRTTVGKIEKKQLRED